MRMWERYDFFVLVPEKHLIFELVVCAYLLNHNLFLSSPVIRYLFVFALRVDGFSCKVYKGAWSVCIGSPSFQMSSNWLTLWVKKFVVRITYNVIQMIDINSDFLRLLKGATFCRSAILNVER